MPVTKYDIVNAINTLSLNNKCICVHASLKSFGYVDGGAKTIIDAFLDEGCTILAPAFSYDFYMPPLIRIKRNGYDYNNFSETLSRNKKIFSTESNEISESMGAIPYEMLQNVKRKRGYHPLNSFVSLGSMADELVNEQSEIKVYSPFKKLQEVNGYIILMGLNLDSMTAIHYAEQLAGRNLFISWVNDINGNPTKALVGGCSNGFDQLQPVLKNIERQYYVGNSLWRIFPINETIEKCVNAIRGDVSITHCLNPNCIRCNDAALGGPSD